MIQVIFGARSNRDPYECREMKMSVIKNNKIEQEMNTESEQLRLLQKP